MEVKLPSTRPAAPPPSATTSGPENPVTPKSTTPSPLTAKERLTVGFFSLVQCGVFSWACVLPWDKSSTFVALCVVSAATHAATSASCFFPPTPAHVRLHTWFAACVASFLVLAWTTWAVTTSALYLSTLYGGLGTGMSAVLVAVWALTALLTLPMFIWGTYRTWGVWRYHRVGAVAAGVLFAAIQASGALTATSAASAADVASPAHEPGWTTLLEQNVSPIVRRSSTAAASDAFLSARPRPTCGAEIDADILTAFVHYLDPSGKTRARCVQSETLPTLAAAVAALLEQEGSRGPVSVDRLLSTRRLVETPSWLLSLSLRPGLDGACLDRTCLTPWQLTAQSHFVTHSPLAFLGDLKFGVSLADLTETLSPKQEKKRWAGASELEAARELVTFTSEHTVVTGKGDVQTLVRLHPSARELTAAHVDEATAAFEGHILSAQQESGQFRYTLDPFTQKAENRELNLARQAGTLLALCEAGSSGAAVEDAARRGLQLLLEKRRRKGELWALSLSPKDRYVRLGDSALPLVAMLACRSRVGERFDEAIHGLSRFILHTQREDGSFATDYDWKSQRPVDRGEALYAPGQALLALTLLDKLWAARPELRDFGSERDLTQAIQRGMNHVASSHWDIPVAAFFFVEENWNCLTARAALARQRNDAYERFCLDYIRFKSRLILTSDSEVSPEYDGGFGFGNIVPPHNTGAAGFGEALSAAIAVTRARSQSAADEEELLRHVLEFLLRQQWTAESCPMCAPEALGSVSEHMHSPITRIDFAQHAWAAVTHGAAVLDLTGEHS